MKDWQIKIVDVGYKLEKDVYIFLPLYNNETLFMSDGKIITIKEGVLPPRPTLSLNQEQMIAFANALSKEGINPQKEYVEGKLDATEKHLQDMRKLLKL